MTLKGGTSQACAACKYQRRRCLSDCQLAPYFPADQPKMFQNAHRLFGVSNILKILKQVDPSKKSETMRSIIYESDMRQKYPVVGCYGVIHYLFYQVKDLEQQLQTLRLQIEFCKMQRHNSDNHLVPQEDDDSHSLLQLGMSLPDHVNNTNTSDLNGFSYPNNDEQFWDIQQEYGSSIDNNVIDRFEMTVNHNQPEQCLYDGTSQQQQEMMHHFESMHPFVDCVGQSSFVASKVGFESSSSGSDDQSSSLRYQMGHQVTESGGFKT